MGTTNNLRTILNDVRHGRPVIILDGEDREHEADLFVAAQHATPEIINAFITHGRGLICAPITAEWATALHLPLMVNPEENRESHRCQFTISVDAAQGITTGISAADRAVTLRQLADPQAAADDFVKPGHIFPLVAHPNGIATRPGHTEAALALCAMADLTPVGVICELLDADGNAARGATLAGIARRLNYPATSVAEIARHAPHFRHRPPRTVSVHAASAKLPTAYGEFTIHAFTGLADGKPHVALTIGDFSDNVPVLVRVHSQCLTGDTFASLKCDCRGQLESALRAIAHAGRGVLVYLNQEGRGIGLVNKIRAYALQDHGLDTVDANLALGLAADARNYRVAAEMLRALGVTRVELLTNNPNKIAHLTAAGVTVARRIPLVVAGNGINDHYLQVKMAKLGHRLAE